MEREGKGISLPSTYSLNPNYRSKCSYVSLIGGLHESPARDFHVCLPGRLYLGGSDLRLQPDRHRCIYFHMRTTNNPDVRHCTNACAALHKCRYLATFDSAKLERNEGIYKRTGITIGNMALRRCTVTGLSAVGSGRCGLVVCLWRYRRSHETGKPTRSLPGFDRLCKHYVAR